VIRRAISTGVILLGVAAGPARAQTAMDVMGAMQVHEQEQATAGSAAAGSRSIVGAVFGAGPGSTAPAAAPAQPAAAPAPPAEVDGARVAPVAHTGPDGGLSGTSGAPAGAGGVEAPPPSAAALAAERGRDPFRPFTLDLRPENLENEVLTPLQRYEIPQLRLAGVVLDLSPPRAMLQDNSGMGFIITPGTPIGRRHGVVRAIEPKKVVIEERILDYYGREQVHLVAIEMAKDDKPQGTGQE
jgi:hypothetical protein